MEVKKMEKSFWGGKETKDAITPQATGEVIIKEPAILEQVDNRIYFYAEINRAEVLKLNRALKDQSNTIMWSWLSSSTYNHCK